MNRTFFFGGRSRRLRQLAAACGFAFLSGIALNAGTARAGLEGRPAPDVTLGDVSGGKVSISDFKEKRPVLLAFWATWCPYCRRQIPNLVSIRKEFSEEQLALLGVNIGEERGVVVDFMRAQGINYAMLLDPESKAANRYGADGIPYFVLIDRDGRVVETGHDAGKPLQSKLRKLIGGASGQ